MRQSTSNNSDLATESHTYIKVDETGKILESHVLTVDSPSEQDLFTKRREYLLEKAVKDFFDIKDKREIIKNGLSISVRESDYPHMLAIKNELSKRIQCSVKISKRPPKNTQRRSEQENTAAIRKNYLFDKLVKQFYEIEDKAEIREKGLNITVHESDYPHMLAIKDELKELINCDVNVYKKDSQKPEADLLENKKELPVSVINKKRNLQSLNNKTSKIKQKSKKSLQADKFLLQELPEIKHKRSLLAILSGPFFSSLFHLALISVLAVFIQDKYQNDVQEIHMTLAEPENLTVEEPRPIEEPLPEVVKEVEGLNPELQTLNIETSLLKESGLNDAEDIPSVDDNSQIAAITDVEISASTFTSNSIIAGRSGSGRAANLGRFGGSLAGQLSLMKALRWLKSVQKPDGSWGNGSGTSTALTSLALLTFLAHGETQASQEFGTTVSRTIDHLLKTSMNKNTKNGYPHAIMTYAISEAFTMTKIAGLKTKMNECVQVIIDGQQKGGCFNYRYNTGERRQDLSFAGWNYQALKAAYNAGCRIEGLSSTIYQSIKWLQDQSFGKFPYSTSNNTVQAGTPKHTMRAVGVLCLQLFAEGSFEGIADDLEHISTKDLLNFNWEDPPRESLYGWYYATQAMFQAGGEKWKAWNTVFQDVLAKNQNEAGFWEYPGKYHGPKDEISSRVYATTLCAMQLTVYYRYLPSFREDKELGVKRPTQIIDEESDLIE